MRITRRRFLAHAAAGTTSVCLLPSVRARAADDAAPAEMKLGLVTYQWGRDWDLPTLLAHCTKVGLAGVELRTQHQHGVEPSLSPAQRLEVRKRFADSPVVLVGYGSNAEYHSNDAAELKRNIELTKEYVRLMHDCGGSGVKVKPNSLVKDVPREQTLEQIGRALNEVAAFGADYGQQIRLEVHGRDTSELPNIRAIMDVATHPNVGVCWNSNGTDLNPPGIEHNFDLVKNRLGRTVHVRELDETDYPYLKLLQLLSQCPYRGWILLECSRERPDRVAALADQKRVFEELLSRASER